MKLIGVMILLIVSHANAAYFEIEDSGEPGQSRCKKIESGTLREAIDKAKEKFPTCVDRETLVSGTYSVMCKTKSPEPNTKLSFFSETGESCKALIEFQKTQKVPEKFRVKKSKP